MSRKHSTALGIGAAMSGAAVAAFIGMGTAHADIPSGDEGYSILYGGDGTDPGLAADQAANNLTLDTELFDQNPGDAAAFGTAAASFEEGSSHAVENLINAIDPSAFSDQTTTGIVGTLEGGAYLVPEDTLGYLATSLDYFLLTPTGLGDLLTPVIDILLGSPPF
jgi:hypothetical protein